MKVEFEGRTWQLDTSIIDMEQAEAITAYTGLTLSGWETASFDPENAGWLKATRCLYWLMRAQNGEPLPLQTANFAVLPFFTAIGEAIKAEAGPIAEAEPDPTSSGDGPDAEPPPPPAESLPGSDASSTAT